MPNLGSSNTPVEGQSFGLPAGAELTEDANGNLAIADSSGSIVLVRDETNAEWQFENTDLTGINAINASSATLGSVNTDVLNNSPLVGSHYYRTLAGEGFETDYQSQWYDIVTGLSLSQSSSELQITHSGSGAREALSIQPSMPTRGTRTQQWIAQDFTFDISFKLINSATETKLNFECDTPSSNLRVISLPVSTSDGIRAYDSLIGDYRTLTSYATGEQIRMSISLDFDAQTYTVDWDINDGGRSGTQSDMGFFEGADYVNHIVSDIRDTVNEVAQTIDRWSLSKPLFLSWGDSIARGTGYSTLSDDGTDSYSYQLNKQTDGHIFVRNSLGTSTGNIIDAIERMETWAKDQYRPSKLMLAFGVHEVGTPGWTKEAFVEQYLAAIAEARSLGIEPIGYLFTPRNDGKGGSFSRQEDWKNALKAEFNAHNIPYVDAWDAVTTSGSFDSSYYESDKLHLNATGHDQLTTRSINDLGLQ